LPEPELPGDIPRPAPAGGAPGRAVGREQLRRQLRARRLESALARRPGAHRGAAGPRLSEARRHSWHNAPDGAAPGAAPPDIPPQETLPLSDPPEGLQIVQHLGQTYRAMQAAVSSRVGHALPRWRILLTLHACGQCSQKLLAERCRLDPASLTRLLQAMQQQGWVTRSADPHDNRVTNAALTPAGQAVVDQALPRRAA